MKKFMGLFVAIISLGFIASAHSGRTDGSGGHRDTRNVSGLGSYHYHCGGYPAHLHKNGVCPYRTPAKKTTTPAKPVTTNQSKL